MDDNSGGKVEALDQGQTEADTARQGNTQKTAVLSVERATTSGACIGIVSVEGKATDAITEIKIQENDKVDLISAMDDNDNSMNE